MHRQFQQGIFMAVILVVEDDEQIRTLACALIEEQGHKELSASNAEEALALLRSDKLIDLLFTNLTLQEDQQGGIALAIEARDLRPALDVLYTTAQAMTDGMRLLFVRGSSFLAKPYNLDEMRLAIETVLRESLQEQGA